MSGYQKYLNVPTDNKNFAKKKITSLTKKMENNAQGNSEYENQLVLASDKKTNNNVIDSNKSSPLSK